jgi:hypothetical protein
LICIERVVQRRVHAGARKAISFQFLEGKPTDLPSNHA